MRYWILRLREIRRNEDCAATFLRWEQSIQVEDPTFVLPDRGVPLPEGTIQTRLTAATGHLRKLQRTSAEVRIQTYHQQLATYDEDTNPNTRREFQRKAKIVNNTLLGEASRSLYGNLRQVVKPSEYNPLTKIQVP